MTKGRLEGARLRRRIVAEAGALAVYLDDRDLALAALRLRDAAVCDSPQTGQEVAALLGVYACVADAGRRGVCRYLESGGCTDSSFAEAVCPELDRGARLGRLVVRALGELGRKPA